MGDLTETTRNAILTLYEHKGIDAADKKIKELLRQCESGNASVGDRSTIKGELSEMALECHLRYWTDRIKYLAVVKGLCIKSTISSATAEIDVLLASPCRVYLFECKSFKGKKTLTKECYLAGSSSSKDVFYQSKYHLQILEQHLADYHYPTESKISPYQLLLFELSSDSVDDQRDSKWKRNIPLLTLDTIDAWLLEEFQSNTLVQWDFIRLSKKLCDLNLTSKQMFKFHMAKITHRKENSK